MILFITVHLGMIAQTAVSISDLDLYFMVHCLCKFAWCDIAFGGILAILNEVSLRFGLFLFLQKVFGLVTARKIQRLCR